MSIKGLFLSWSQVPEVFEASALLQDCCHLEGETPIEIRQGSSSGKTGASEELVS